MLSALRGGAAGGAPGAGGLGGGLGGLSGPSGLGGAAGGLRPGAGAGAPASFRTLLDDALRTVSQVQDDASRLQGRYSAGSPDVSLEQTMVAMQHSQIAFQAALTVRNRLVSAYSEIMSMNV